MMQWRPCQNYPCYEVNEVGDVRRVKAGIRGGVVGKIMRPYRRADGYNMYILRQDGRSFHVKAHQLVAWAFLGPKPFEHAEVCHNDGSRSNDHFSNLRWDTRKSNHADRIGHGTMSRGGKHPMARLTGEQVSDIRARYAGGELQRALAVEYNVRQGTISRIVNGARWTVDAKSMQPASMR